MFSFLKKQPIIYYCPACSEEITEFWELSPHFMENAIKYGFNSGQPETLNTKQYACKKCGACDRDRLIAYFLQKEIPDGISGQLLHIAPSEPLEKFINTKMPHITQATTDLFMPGVDLVLDITNMPEVADNCYDWLVCSHVLEHVDDDKKAMRELYRVLKPGGCAALLVPINLEMQQTDEELGLSPEERWRRFGQDDHVRLYAKQDFVERLSATGFRVKQRGKRYFGKKKYRQMGISDTSVLYVAYK